MASEYDQEPSRYDGMLEDLFKDLFGWPAGLSRLR